MKRLQSFGFQLELESLKSVKYSWCYEFPKVAPFSGSPGIFVLLSTFLKLFIRYTQNRSIIQLGVFARDGG